MKIIKKYFYRYLWIKLIIYTEEVLLIYKLNLQNQFFNDMTSPIHIFMTFNSER